MGRPAALQRTWILVLNSAARTTECLILLLGPFAGSAAMRPDDGAADHLQHVQCAAAVGQRLKRKRSQTPDSHQRRNCFHTEFHLPNAAGKSRHGAPVRQIQSMPSSLCRWFKGGRPPRDEAVIRNGAKIAHSSSVMVESLCTPSLSVWKVWKCVLLGDTIRASVSGDRCFERRRGEIVSPDLIRRAAHDLHSRQHVVRDQLSYNVAARPPMPSRLRAR